MAHFEGVIEGVGKDIKEKQASILCVLNEQPGLRTTMLSNGKGERRGSHIFRHLLAVTLLGNDVSGSAAMALKMKSDESGAGRFHDFALPPLTFNELMPRCLKSQASGKMLSVSISLIWRVLSLSR